MYVFFLNIRMVYSTLVSVAKFYWLHANAVAYAVFRIYYRQLKLYFRTTVMYRREHICKYIKQIDSIILAVI